MQPGCILDPNIPITPRVTTSYDQPRLQNSWWSWVVLWRSTIGSGLWCFFGASGTSLWPNGHDRSVMGRSCLLFYRSGNDIRWSGMVFSGRRKFLVVFSSRRPQSVGYWSARSIANRPKPQKYAFRCNQSLTSRRALSTKWRLVETSCHSHPAAV